MCPAFLAGAFGSVFQQVLVAGALVSGRLLAPTAVHDDLDIGGHLVVVIVIVASVADLIAWTSAAALWPEWPPERSRLCCPAHAANEPTVPIDRREPTDGSPPPP